jgi:hypothetical protein
MSTDLVHSIASSNLPTHHKRSIIGDWMGRARSGGAGLARRVGTHGMASVHVVRDFGEGAMTGAALAAVHATVGLDVEIPGTKHKVPADLGVALLGAGIAIGMPLQDGARDARTIGAQAGAIFSFRKVYDFVAAKRKAAGHTVPAFSGDYAEEWSGNQGGNFGADAASQRLTELARGL